jgi:hypothetical protein
MHEITFVPGDVLQIDNARITYRNFAGAATAYNRAGNRNFTLIIEDDETAQELINRGWNVKIKPPRVDGEEPFRTMEVRVKYNNGYGPDAYLRSGAAVVKLTEDTIGRLDKVSIQSVDLDIRAFDWEMPGGKSGRTAYLNSIEVTQRVDRFAARYATEEE